MELIQITKENLVQEHICCAISNEKDPRGLRSITPANAPLRPSMFRF